MQEVPGTPSSPRRMSSKIHLSRPLARLWMARLQMALYSDTMPSYENMAAAKYPSLGQERHGVPASKQQSHLELMRSQYQNHLRKKGEKVANMYIQQQEIALSKARSNAYQHPRSAQPDTQPAPGRPGFLSAGYNKPDLGRPRQTMASNWTAKKKSGVDRAYPLKPIFHKKAVSLHNIIATDEARSPLQESSPPADNGSSRSSGTSPAFAQGLLELQKRSRSIPGRAEPWRELEALGENMQQEIRRKEAMLREKLRRTEEELRRIQREREQAEQEESREREGRERRRRAEAARKPVPGKMKSGNAFRKPVMVEDSSDDEESEDSHMARRWGDSRGDRALPPAYRPSPLMGTQEHAVERLKKERLVASNSKIRNKQPPSSQEPVAPLCPSESSSSYRPSPKRNGSSCREPDYQRSEYRLTAPSAKQAASPIRAVTPPELSDEDEDGPDWESPYAAEADSQLEPCHLCGRRFLPERLEKHAAACTKMKNSKRKVFDSCKARTKGTDLEPYMYRKSRATPSQEQQIQPKKSTWRQKHETFIRNIRQNREIQQVIAMGGKLSDLPQPPPDENPDYITCRYCSRRFAPKVAERHIPMCENIKNKPRPPPQRRR